ncbi:MAG: hypothetical protein WKG03_22315, partial [Telluria sp.]
MAAITTSDGSLLRIREPINLPENRHWVKCYWVESTAPINVDDPEAEVSQEDREIDAVINTYTQEGDPDAMLQQIAEHLYAQAQLGKQPEIVLTVHGFNNSRADAWKLHFGSYLHINHDAAVADREEVVCLGYRWPSEKMRLGNFKSSLSALPLLAMVLLVAAALAAWLGREIAEWLGTATGVARGIKALAAVLGLTLAILPLSALLLRAIVYFRDVYRATHYAV